MVWHESVMATYGPLRYGRLTKTPSTNFFDIKMISF